MESSWNYSYWKLFKKVTAEKIMNQKNLYTVKVITLINEETK